LVDDQPQSSLVWTDTPGWDALLAAVHTVKPGKNAATGYDRAVEALLTPLFYPPPALDEQLERGLRQPPTRTRLPLTTG
jgi:hypothetical protein